MVFQNQKQINNIYNYLNQLKNFRLHASVETAIEHDYHDEWPIVVTCYSR